MGKLNYTKRKIQGLKLGQVVAKDLMKRVTPGPTSKAAQRDPYVELDVSGRQLTDEGFAEIAGALSTSTSYEGELGKVVRLEELCLAGNALTAGCLLALAKVVQDAAAELRDLDLSDNNISVRNVEDALVWEEFLRSFRKCFVLRRLNLSGNELGSWAFEILARLYGDEEPLDLFAEEEEDMEFPHDELIKAEHGKSYEGVSGLSMRVGNMKVVSENRDDTEHSLANVKEGSKRRNSRKGYSSQAVFKFPTYLVVTTDSSPSKTALPHPTHAVEAQSMFATTRGLRSVPYIIFSNTSMTDTCALHLSFVLQNHNLPKHLQPYVPAKAGSSAHELEAYDSTSGCQGIVYLPNDKLGSAGLKVMEVAELVRKGGDSESFQGNSSPSKSLSMTVTYPRRVSDAGFNSSSTQPHRRRRSTLSSGAGTHFTHPGGTASVTNELDRARSRIQGGLLKDPGPQAVELWSASVKMLSIARQILLEERKEKVDRGKATLEEGPSTETPLKPTYASKLLIGVSAPGEPILAITGISNAPTTPVLTRKRKESNVPASASARQTTPLGSTIQTNTVPIMINTSPEPSPMPFGLSEQLWGHIIALASGAVGVVSSKQQKSIIHWAKNRDTLGREREVLGKSENEQIWRVLEGMGCLSYDVKT